jgi:hypothetical protein
MSLISPLIGRCGQITTPARGPGGEGSNTEGLVASLQDWLGRVLELGRVDTGTPTGPELIAAARAEEDAAGLDSIGTP